jgi:hypothetical protein
MKILGGESIAFFRVGGTNGRLFQDLLAEEGLMLAEKLPSGCPIERTVGSIFSMSSAASLSNRGWGEDPLPRAYAGFTGAQVDFGALLCESKRLRQRST